LTAAAGSPDTPFTQTRKKEAAMRPGVLVPVVLTLSFLPVALAATPESESAPQDPQRAEYAIRAAFSAWAYNQFWRLYTMGSTQSRASLSERDFVDQMEKGWRKPGVGVEILEVKVTGSYAVTKARVRLELETSKMPGSPVVRPGPVESRPMLRGPIVETVQLGLVYQEGDWRISLYEFLGMARR
jgi:hypothetical protein